MASKSAAKKLENKRRKAPALAATLRFYGDEFIFDTASGMFYRVNPTASFILRSLQSGTEPTKIADEVQGRYGVPRAAAVRDIELLRNDLTSLEPVGGSRT